MSIVSNSSPLILLAKIGRFNLLRDLFELVYVPESVYREVAIVGSGRSGSKEVEEGLESGWIKVESVQINPELELILGRGEAEAIILAEKLKLPLLIDERKGRKVAERRGIKIIGTLGIILKAYKLGLIGDLNTEIEKLINAGIRIDKNILRKLL
jgi:predicted nucleic acid-binding protein